MGGYGSLRFAFKYPQMFVSVAAHMPALLFGLLIALAGPVFYWISRKRWGQKALVESALAPSGD